MDGGGIWEAGPRSGMIHPCTPPRGSRLGHGHTGIGPRGLAMPGFCLASVGTSRRLRRGVGWGVTGEDETRGGRVRCSRFGLVCCFWWCWCFVGDKAGHPRRLFGPLSSSLASHHSSHTPGKHSGWLHCCSLETCTPANKRKGILDPTHTPPLSTPIPM